MTMCHRTYSMSGACDFSAGFFGTSHRHAATKATFARPAMEPHARETCCMQIMPPCNLECKDWGVHVAVNFVQVFLHADFTSTACGNQLQILSCSGVQQCVHFLHLFRILCSLCSNGSVAEACAGTCGHLDCACSLVLHGFHCCMLRLLL